MSSLNIEPFLLDIEQLSGDIESFLKANILIINITSKNLSAFKKLIKEIEKTKIQYVLFVSSTSVYKNSNKIVSESDGEESGQSPLLKIENLFRNSTKFTTTVVRFAGLIGYGRNPGRFFSQGRSVSNPDTGVNLIHRDDCIGIISQIVEQGVWGELFNACADTHPTKREFYTQAALVAGQSVPNFVDSDNQSFKIISNQKVKQVLGYEFRYPDLMSL